MIFNVDHKVVSQGTAKMFCCHVCMCGNDITVQVSMVDLVTWSLVFNVSVH
jgi:hypothetical protein